ncbi:MAG: hypothetical protein ACFFFG_02820 [Candidatus Thorarchaeota archaeon]
MGDLHQVIVQNRHETGLDVVASTLGRSQLHDISYYLPSVIPLEFDRIFLTKFIHNTGAIGLRFVFEDIEDKWGRKGIKTHTLLIDPDYYNEKTAQYFIAPFVNGTVNMEEDRLLTANDFDLLPPFPVSSKFIELALCKKHVQINSKEIIDPMQLIQVFASLDRIIPPVLNHAFSFQTMVSPDDQKHYKNQSMVFSLKKLNQAVFLEDVQNETSEFATVRAISKALSDLPMLRQLQQKLFKDLPERRLSLKIRWRFGIKTFSDASRSFDVKNE